MHRRRAHVKEEFGKETVIWPLVPRRGYPEMAGREYRFRVRSINRAGCKEWSAASGASHAVGWHHGPKATPTTLLFMARGKLGSNRRRPARLNFLGLL